MGLSSFLQIQISLVSTHQVMPNNAEQLDINKYITQTYPKISFCFQRTVNIESAINNVNLFETTWLYIDEFVISKSKLKKIRNMKISEIT